jgi:hypothetical protein
MYCTVWHDITNVGVGDVPQFQLVIWPKPDAAYTLKTRFRCTVLPMTIDGERGMWGALHDQTILKMARVLMMSITEPGYADAKREEEAAIKESIVLDRENVPNRIADPSWRRNHPNRSNVMDVDGNTLIEYP